MPAHNLDVNVRKQEQQRAEEIIENRLCARDHAKVNLFEALLNLRKTYISTQSESHSNSR